jgi:3-phosphoglycerate kinase
MFNKKTIKDINIAGKRVLVRVDYNVSLGLKVGIADQLRLTQSLPTIKYLLKNNCTVILMSHLGQPEGKVEPKFSLAPVAQALGKELGRKINFVKDYLSAKGQDLVKSFGQGQVVLLENLRFHPGEEANDPGFAKKLANLADIFINDGFGVSHRAHASVVGVAKYLPAVAGLLLTQEIESIEKIIDSPKKPLVSILGGAKTETKIKLINKLLKISDKVLLGGCLANTFLKAKGVDVGQSLVDQEALNQAKLILKNINHSRLVLPTDFVWSDRKILDIGPQTCQQFSQVIGLAKTIIWNGPMGMAEKPAFVAGTQAIYKAISYNHQAVSLVGGGDTIACLAIQDHLRGITYLSTGGGAMLEFIEKGTLPGIEVLEDKND